MITLVVIVYLIYLLPKNVFFIRSFEVSYPLKHKNLTVLLKLIIKETDTISLSRHEQVCLSGLRFERTKIVNYEQKEMTPLTDDEYT